jgi:hypothetical protein
MQSGVIRSGAEVSEFVRSGLRWVVFDVLSVRLRHCRLKVLFVLLDVLRNQEKQTKIGCLHQRNTGSLTSPFLLFTALWNWRLLKSMSEESSEPDRAARVRSELQHNGQRFARLTLR